MAQRKPTPPASNKPAAKATAASSKPLSKAAGAKRPPAKKPGKSIVNQRQTPWGLIAVTVVIVLFAAGIVTYAVANHKSTPAANGGCSKMIGSDKTSYLNENECASEIQGVTFTKEPSRDHVDGVVKYDVTPPVGGAHSQVWADCTGTVYAAPIANENAVHMLEHGAIWITYEPDLNAGDVAKLSDLVSGKDRMAMSPYTGLTSPITLQAWGYQLKVDSANDPRIEKFITALRYNPKTTPEYGATCSNPTFIQTPSTPGHPVDS